jgi:hypothetical protein
MLLTPTKLRKHGRGHPSEAHTLDLECERGDLDVCFAGMSWYLLVTVSFWIPDLQKQVDKTQGETWWLDSGGLVLCQFQHLAQGCNSAYVGPIIR